MLNIIALGGSNSAESINKTLAVYAAHQINNATVTVVDLHLLNLPMFGIEEEAKNGIPAAVQKLNRQIAATDGLVISLAEHNGCYSVAFKNAFDWLSRIDGKVWQDKPMLLMGAAPGPRGAQTVLEIAKTGFPRKGGTIVASFSFPSFEENFKINEITNPELKAALNTKIKLLEEAIARI